MERTAFESTCADHEKRIEQCNKDLGERVLSVDFQEYQRGVAKSFVRREIYESFIEENERILVNLLEQDRQFKVAMRELDKTIDRTTWEISTKLNATEVESIKK